eukprot:2682835-Alexandrium_andersonii.AAC.1
MPGLLPFSLGRPTCRVLARGVLRKVVAVEGRPRQAEPSSMLGLRHPLRLSEEAADGAAKAIQASFQKGEEAVDVRGIRRRTERRAVVLIDGKEALLLIPDRR